MKEAGGPKGNDNAEWQDLQWKRKERTLMGEAQWWRCDLVWEASRENFPKEGARVQLAPERGVSKVGKQGRAFEAEEVICVRQGVVKRMVSNKLDNLEQTTP